MLTLFIRCSIYICLLLVCVLQATSPAHAAKEKLIESTANTSPKTLYLVRHFEKEQGLMSGQGKQDPQLTDKGQKRALRLAHFLNDKNITAVFSTTYKRTMQTAKPTADFFNLSIQHYDPSALNAFAQHLLKSSSTQAGHILVVGHSNTTPQLLKLLGGPELSLSESDYGDLFVLNLLQDGSANEQSFYRTEITLAQEAGEPMGYGK